jgi:hypothetical protein
VSEAPESRGVESQPHRTRLAWRRTSAALVTSGLLAAAVLLHRGGNFVAVLAVTAILALTYCGLRLSSRRVEALDQAIAAGGPYERAGRTPAALVTLVAVNALLAIVVIVASGR